MPAITEEPLIRPGTRWMHDDGRIATVEGVTATNVRFRVGEDEMRRVGTLAWLRAWRPL